MDNISDVKKKKRFLRNKPKEYISKIKLKEKPTFSIERRPIIIYFD
jgi:hypothetical protein